VSHHVILGVVLIGAWALLRFRHTVWRIIGLLIYTPPEEMTEREYWVSALKPRKLTIKPTERCWACGAEDGELEAVMMPAPEQKAKQLFIKYHCKICGAFQYFAPIVPNGEVPLKPCARVGPVQGKDKT
jgi:hypothetical protein